MAYRQLAVTLRKGVGSAALSRVSSRTVIVRGGGGPIPPPFVRISPIREKLSEGDELVWDDAVAPETYVDFEAPHIARQRALKSFGAMVAVLATVLTVLTISDPVSRDKKASREISLLPVDVRAFDYFPKEKSEADDEEEE